MRNAPLDAPAPPAAHASHTRRFYSPNEVCALLGFEKPLDRSTLWRWVRDKRIDPPIQIGPNRTGWTVGYIESWIASRPCGVPEQPAGLRDATPRAQETLRRLREEAKQSKAVEHEMAAAGA